MGMNEKRDHRRFILKRRSTLCYLSTMLLLVSLWFGPFSLLFLSLTAAVAVIYSGITLLSWKYNSMGLFIPAIILVLCGQLLAIRWSFPTASLTNSNPWLEAQYASTVVGVFCLTLMLFDSWIRSFVHLERGPQEG